MKQGRDGHGEGEEVNTRKGKGERIPYILEHGYAYGVGLQTRTFHFQYNCDIPVIHYAQIEQTRAKKKEKNCKLVGVETIARGQLTTSQYERNHSRDQLRV